MQIGDFSEIKLQMMQMNSALLEKLIVGSEIEGQLMTEDGQLLLDTKAGIKLPISLCQGEAKLGELLQFIVVSKSMQGAVLRIVDPPHNDQVTQEPKDLVQKVIQNLNLPKGETTKRLVEGFVEKQLPLERSDLMKSFYIHKQMRLPVPVIINLLEAKGILETQDIYHFQGLRDMGGKTAWVNQLTQWIEAHDLPETTYRQLSVVLGEREKDMVEANEQAKQADGNMPKAMPMSEGSMGSKEIMGPLAQKAWLIMQVEKKIMTFYETLKTLPAEARGKYLKEVGAVEAVIEKVLATLEEAPVPQEAKATLETLKNHMTQFTQMQSQGQMFCMPLHYQEQVRDVELYLFKPKKKHPKAQKELYVVIGLDMPALEYLEIHIHQIEKELVIGMAVCDVGIQKHLSRYIQQLIAMLGQIGYTIKQAHVYVKTESSEVVTMAQQGTPQVSGSVDYRI